MASDCPGKNMWPELLGANGKEAVAKIERENRHVDAFTLPEGSPVTKDFKCNRVRVFVDPHGKVSQVPRIG